MTGKIRQKIEKIFLIYHGVVALGHFVALCLLVSLKLVNAQNLVFLSGSWFTWFVNARRILRSYLRTREQKVLDQLPDIR